MGTRLLAHRLHTKDIKEEFDGAMASITEASIDDATRTVKGVAVFGRRKSDNGYEYNDKTIDKLTTAAEGAKVFINHPSKQEIKDRDGVRDLRDWAGVYTNPKRNGEKIHADLQVREAYWPLVKDIATMKPMKVGNSINARVKVFKDKEGKESIVDLDRLYSVDLVASGATIDNLWESTSQKTDSEEEKVNEAIINIIEDSLPTHILFIKEGVLADSIKQDELRRKMNSLIWRADDLIMKALTEKEIGTFSERRKRITSILDDLEAELNSLAPQIKPDEDRKSVMYHEREQVAGIDDEIEENVIDDEVDEEAQVA